MKHLLGTAEQLSVIEPVNIIKDAREFAYKVHEGQVRKYNGRPYIEHPMRVALATALLSYATDTMIAAAWLHDVVEDCGTPIDEIAFLFGRDVAFLVKELTNTSKLDYPGKNRAFRKAKDREKLRTVSMEAESIKLIDRIDNLRDMADSGDADFMVVYARESELLLKALAGTDANLEQELLHEICWCRLQAGMLSGKA